MIRRFLDSSEIESIRYSFVKEVLEIEFHTGEAFQYIGVPDDIYTGLIDAESHIEYYYEYIQDAYDQKKIELYD